MKKIAIITGASSGLGAEYARQLDHFLLDEIWLVARRRNRLEALAVQLQKESRILDGDLLDPGFRKSLAEQLAQEPVDLRFLINSAGMGVTGPFLQMDQGLVQRTLRLNIEVLTDLCAICLPYMGQDACLLNISSVASFLPQPNFAVYAASKSYVLSFSRALAAELAAKKIRVTAVCPNPMETEFFQYSSQKSTSKIKKIGLEDPEDVVSLSLDRAQSGKDISVSHFLAKAIHLASKLFPTSFALWVEKKMGMY